MRPDRLSASERGYDHRWAKAREAHLAKEPLCRRCKAAGRTVPANTVDHIIPHRGDDTLFWDENNWESMCSGCHSGDKQRIEKSGRDVYRGCDAQGNPLDQRHHWRAA